MVYLLLLFQQNILDFEHQIKLYNLRFSQAASLAGGPSSISSIDCSRAVSLNMGEVTRQDMSEEPSVLENEINSVCEIKNKKKRKKNQKNKKQKIKKTFKLKNLILNNWFFVKSLFFFLFFFCFYFLFLFLFFIFIFYFYFLLFFFKLYLLMIELLLHFSLFMPSPNTPDTIYQIYQCCQWELQYKTSFQGLGERISHSKRNNFRK